ncbi:MAG: type II toxin-antitoxin system VapC family toxin [Spirochaetia bacterium]|nr:type II toxin-antitoxin system VapC family toxin [Spirochaetia bacterium]
MIFIDSNIPMYLVGADHPNKERTISVLQRIVRDETRLVTDAETLLEILHRYTAINRMEAIQAAYDAILGIVDEVFQVGTDDMILAKDILLASSGVSAMDAVHAAVMKNNGIDHIFSFDSDFDVFSFITRIF